jgi:hypothetical protein
MAEMQLKTKQNKKKNLKAKPVNNVYQFNHSTIFCNHIELARQEKPRTFGS